MPTNLLVTSWEHFVTLFVVRVLVSAVLFLLNLMRLFQTCGREFLGSCVLAGRIRKWFEWPALVQHRLGGIWFQFSSVCYCDLTDTPSFSLKSYGVLFSKTFPRKYWLLTYKFEIKRVLLSVWRPKDSLSPVSYLQPWGKEGLLPKAWNFLVDGRELSHTDFGEMLVFFAFNSFRFYQMYRNLLSKETSNFLNL